MTTIDLSAFKATLGQDTPPPGLRLAVEGLWWDAHGDWDRAHRCAMAQDDAEGAALHAYLHRKEGDHSNAGYWYARAGRAPFAGKLEDEWAALATEFVGR